MQGKCAGIATIVGRIAQAGSADERPAITVGIHAGVEPQRPAERRQASVPGM